jgi:hypothetical protein
MLTYQRFLDLAVEQALAGAGEQAEGDIEIRAEALAASAMHALASKVAGDPNERHTLIRPITIVLTNGVGTIPDTVLLSYFCSATLTNPSDLTEDYAYVPFFDDYRETADRRLGYFHNQDSILYVTQPVVPFSATTGLTGNITLTTSTAPVVPAAATDPITNLPAELEDDLIGILASMLRGGK